LPRKHTMLCYSLFFFISFPVAQLLVSQHPLYAWVTSSEPRLTDCLREVCLYQFLDDWSNLCQHIGCRISKTDVKDPGDLGEAESVCALVTIKADMNQTVTGWSNLQLEHFFFFLSFVTLKQERIVTCKFCIQCFSSAEKIDPIPKHLSLRTKLWNVIIQQPSL